MVSGFVQRQGGSGFERVAEKRGVGWERGSERHARTGRHRRLCVRFRLQFGEMRAGGADDNLARCQAKQLNEEGSISTVFR